VGADLKYERVKMPKVDNSNIRKIAENYYQIRITHNHKVHSKHIEGTLAEARIFRDKLRLEIATGLITSYEKITLQKFIFDIFIKDHLAFKEVNTKQGYISIFKNYLQPLANNQMSKITTLDIDNLFADIREKKPHLTETTLSNIYKALNSLFNYALRKQLVSQNPMRFANRPKPIAFRKLNMWSLEDVSKFLEVAKEVQPKFHPIYALGFYMGRRRSELLAITWDNIDFDKSLITLDKTIRTKVTPYPSIKNYGKNSHTLKTLSVIPQVLEILKIIQNEKIAEAISSKKPIPRPSDFVFADENNKLIHVDTVTRNFKKLATELKLPFPFTFHSSRHKFITDLNRLGVNPRDIADYVGHSTTAMALNVYYHPNEESIENTANKISEMYNEQK